MQANSVPLNSKLAAEPFVSCEGNGILKWSFVGDTAHIDLMQCQQCPTEYKIMLHIALQNNSNIKITDIIFVFAVLCDRVSIG